MISRHAAGAVVLATAPLPRSGRKPAKKAALTPLQEKVLGIVKRKGRTFADSVADAIPSLDQYTAEKQVNEALRTLKTLKLVREPAPGQWVAV